jgi:ferredoxin--NADP+ reductase
LPTFKVAIVGAGPAGYFTAQSLQNAQTDEMSFQIDTVKKFPNPTLGGRAVPWQNF